MNNRSMHIFLSVVTLDVVEFVICVFQQINHFTVIQNAASDDAAVWQQHYEQRGKNDYSRARQ